MKQKHAFIDSPSHAPAAPSSLLLLSSLTARFPIALSPYSATPTLLENGLRSSNATTATTIKINRRKKTSTAIREKFTKEGDRSHPRKRSKKAIEANSPSHAPAVPSRDLLRWLLEAKAAVALSPASAAPALPTRSIRSESTTTANTAIIHHAKHA